MSQHVVLLRSRIIVRFGFIYYYLILLLLGLADRQALGESPSHLCYTNVADIHKLSPKDAENAYPVKLVGTVTFRDPSWGLLFISDNSNGIFVSLSTGTYPTNREQIEVTGQTGAGSFLPVITRATWQHIGAASLPVPRTIKQPSQQAKELDCEWAELTGMVRRTFTIGNNDHLQIDTMHQHFNARAFVLINPNDTNSILNQLVGAQVSISGVCGIDYDSTRGVTGMKLFVPDASFIKINKQAPVDPFQTPLIHLSELRNLVETNNPQHQIHIQGVVTHLNPTNEIIIQEADTGIRILGTYKQQISLGDPVEAFGFIAPGIFAPVLEDALIRRSTIKQIVEPKKITPAKVLWGDCDAQLIQITGRIQNKSVTDTNFVITLLQDGILFGVSSHLTNIQHKLHNLRVGDQIQVTGVCKIAGNKAGTPQSFEIQLRTAEDIAVLPLILMFTLKQIVITVCIAVIVCGFALLWVFLLKRQVRKQTNAISDGLRKEIEMEKRFHDLLENASFPVVIFHKESLSILFANQRAIARLCDKKPLNNNTLISDFCDQPKTMEVLLHKLLEAQKITEFEMRLKPANGDAFWAILCANVIEFDQKSAIFLSFNDISERKRIEESLSERETNFHTFFQTIDDLIVVGTPQGKILFTNKAFEQKLGYLPGDFESLNILDLHPADKRSEAEQIFSAMFRGERTTCPLPLIKKDGSLIPVETRVWFGMWNGINCIFGVIKDLTSEQEAHQRFERLFRNNPALMAISTTSNRKFFDVNESFLKTLGYSRAEVIGKSSADLNLFVQPEKQKEIAHLLHNTGRISDIEMQIRKKNGDIIYGIFSGELISSQGQQYFLTVMVDISERKRMEILKEKYEVQNRMLQKTESLRRMAGAIAHHFNNQLQVVMMNLEMSLGGYNSDPEQNELLKEALNSTNKASEMSSLMLTYLGQGCGKRERVNLSQILNQCLTLLKTTMPKNVVLECDFPSNIPYVNADASQLQQVVSNLIQNAAESCSDNPGVVSIIIKTVYHDSIALSNRFPVEWEGNGVDYACIEVTDTGCGIENSDIEKLFDPFYSKKNLGRGMGLAVTLGIVRSYGGCITVESVLKKGSAFRVYLPSTMESYTLAPKPPENQIAHRSRGKLLLIEDEVPLQKIVTKALTQLGFKVITANDGAEAIKIFQDYQNEIRLVITDLVMPHVNGWDTLAALRKISPNIPVIMSSGYSESVVNMENHTEMPQAFLSKPYVFDELNRTINTILKS